LCVVKLEKNPIFSTSEKLSSEMEGFFLLAHLATYHIFSTIKVKAKIFDSLFFFLIKGGQEFVFLNRLSCKINLPNTSAFLINILQTFGVNFI